MSPRSWCTGLRACSSGGTGTGKTTTLNVLSSFIPDDERIVTIEDAKELQLHQDHVLALESRPPNIEGRGEVTIRDLVKNSLRMRPDRIVVGECRSGEALDMLQAMNTGHDGSITTIHSNSPRDTLSRIETMTLMSGFDLPMLLVVGGAGAAFGADTLTVRRVDTTAFPKVKIVAMPTKPGTTAADFTVKEGGKPVKIDGVVPLTSSPKGVVIAVDTSGSMSQDGKLEAVQAAIRDFVSRKRPQDQMAIVSFNNSAEVIQGLTSDANKLSQSVDRLTPL